MRSPLFPSSRTRRWISCCVICCLAALRLGAQEETPTEPAEPAEAEKAADEGGAAPADGAVATAANAAPSNYWSLEFEFKSLRMISPKQGFGTGNVYWYMLYTLENPAKEPRDVNIEVTANSDGGKEYADIYLPTIERGIERKENRTLFGKTDLFDLILKAKRKPGDPKYNYFTMKAGEKRQCVAVFNQLDHNANKITVRISGLTNEIKQVVKEDGNRFLENRVRELYFDRPGDEHEITLDSFRLVGKDWAKLQVPAGSGASGAAGPRQAAAKAGGAPEAGAGSEGSAGAEGGSDDSPPAPEASEK